MAQAAHAVSYLAAKDALSLYQHPTITILNVGNEEDLIFWSSKYVHIKGNPDGFMFYEPDLEREATAFACYTEGSEFATLPLALKE